MRFGVVRNEEGGNVMVVRCANNHDWKARNSIQLDAKMLWPMSLNIQVAQNYLLFHAALYVSDVKLFRVPNDLHAQHSNSITIDTNSTASKEKKKQL